MYDVNKSYTGISGSQKKREKINLKIRQKIRQKIFDQNGPQPMTRHQCRRRFGGPSHKGTWELKFPPVPRLPGGGNDAAPQILKGTWGLKLLDPASPEGTRDAEMTGAQGTGELAL